MKVLLITEFVRRFPWSPTLWAADLGGALARRGHEVTCACDGLEDPALFRGVALAVRDVRRTLRRFSPLAFQKWGLGLEASGKFDATISLTPLVPADLWIAHAPSAAALVRTLAGAHQTVSAALEVVSRPWLPVAWAAENWAQRRAAGRANHPRLARLGALNAPEGVAPLGYASRLKPSDQAGRAALRQRVRGLLGIAPERPAVLLSCVHPGRPGLDAMLQGVTLLREKAGGPVPDLLVVGRRSHGMYCAGERAGCAAAMRFLGGTWRMDAALVGADLAVAPWTDRTPFSTGRFVADALRMACPILTHARTPGAELIEPAHFGTPEVGGLVESATPEAWCAAIGSALERLAGTARAARDAGAAMSMDNVACRVERLMGEVGR